VKLKLTHLEAFVWVADLGSFRRAAERLSTTQPNISTRISALEQILNATLMERDAGSVRLTSKGQELLDHARQVLRSAESFIEAAETEALYEGVLKLGVTEMIVHTWLRQYLRLLKELGTYDWVWVASPELEISEEKKHSLADLAAFPILTHARDTRPFEEVASHFRGAQSPSVRLVPSSNLAACLHMTIDGMGIATLPAAMVREAIMAKQLHSIHYDWFPDSLNFRARYDADRSPAFVAHAARLAKEVSSRYRSEFLTESP